MGIEKCLPGELLIFLLNKNKEEIKLENMYESPKSDVQPASASNNRPVLVWIIFILTCIGMLSLISHFLMVTGNFPMDDITANYYANITVLDNLLMVVSMGLGFVAALQLFRLKKSALYLMLAQLVLFVLFTIYNLNNSNYTDFMKEMSANIYLALAPGAVFMLLYVIYTYYLYKKGTLK